MLLLAAPVLAASVVAGVVPPDARYVLAQLRGRPPGAYTWAMNRDGSATVTTFPPPGTPDPPMKFTFYRAAPGVPNRHVVKPDGPAGVVEVLVNPPPPPEKP